MYNIILSTSKNRSLIHRTIPVIALTQEKRNKKEDQIKTHFYNWRNKKDNDQWKISNFQGTCKASQNDQNEYMQLMEIIIRVSDHIIVKNNGNDLEFSVTL